MSIEQIRKDAVTAVFSLGAEPTFDDIFDASRLIHKYFMASLEIPHVTPGDTPDYYFYSDEIRELQEQVSHLRDQHIARLKDLTESTEKFLEESKQWRIDHGLDQPSVESPAVQPEAASTSQLPSQIGMRVYSLLDKFRRIKPQGVTTCTTSNRLPLST